MTPDVEQAVIDPPAEPIRIVTRADFTQTAGTPRGGLRRMHLFARPGGGEDQCGGPGFCRECIREAAQ